MQLNQLTRHGRSDHEKDVATELAESAPRWIAWAPIVWRRGRAFYQRRKAGKQIENLVQLKPLEFRVYIPAADRGKIYFTFVVANFGRAIIEADRVIMRGITIGTRQTEADSEMLRADGAASPGTYRYRNIRGGSTGAGDTRLGRRNRRCSEPPKLSKC